MYLLSEYPMKAGLIENWSDVEDVWEYMLYDELGIEEGNHPILITEIANTPKKNREKIAEVRPFCCHQLEICTKSPLWEAYGHFLEQYNIKF